MTYFGIKKLQLSLSVFVVIHLFGLGWAQAANEKAQLAQICPNINLNDSYWVCAKGSRLAMFQQNNLSASLSIAEVPLQKGMVGLGPVSALKGELTIYDGELFVSTLDDNKQEVAYTGEAPSAIFFALGYAEQWQAFEIIEPVEGLMAIEKKIESLAKAANIPTHRAFPFKIEGRAQSIVHHVIFKDNQLPHTMDLHKKAKFKFENSNVDVRIAGIWAKTEDIGRYTHPGKHTHLHAILPQASGHVDKIKLASGSIVYLPMLK